MVHQTKYPETDTMIFDTIINSALETKYQVIKGMSEEEKIVIVKNTDDDLSAKTTIEGVS